MRASGRADTRAGTSDLSLKWEGSSVVEQTRKRCAVRSSRGISMSRSRRITSRTAAPIARPPMPKPSERSCPECRAGYSPWYDDGSGLWVHDQKPSLMIVPCEDINPSGVNDMTLKEFVDRLDDDAFAELRRAIESRVKVDGTELTQEEVDFLRKGKFVPAVKSFRNRTGVSLKEAKDYIDSVKVQF